MEPRVTYPDLQIHSGVRNAVLVDRHSRVNFAEIGKKKYPSGAILHFDADLDPYTEQAGGVHTFNHAILSPQYQLQPDGSSVDVGAKVAADFYNGERWLRSCGAVTNMLTNSVFEGAVSGTPGTAPTGWSFMAQGGAFSVEGAYLGVAVTSNRQFISHSIYLAANTSYYYEIDAICSGGVSVGNCITAAVLPVGATVAFFMDGVGVANGVVPSPGVHKLGLLVQTSTTAGNGYFRLGAGVSNNVTGTVTISKPQLTQSPYPLPYVPTTAAGPVTQPASNATASGGMWFANPDDSQLWGLLTGGAMTAGIRARLNFASADLPNSSTLNILTPDDVAGRFLTIQKNAGGALTAVLNDGTNSATVTLAAWNRGDVLHFFPQVAANGTQMRIGYKTEAATSITWGSLATYAGTFGPDATLDRLMIGYLNAYPFGVNKFTVVPGAIADAEILGWWK